jgi:hypothetical protein
MMTVNLPAKTLDEGITNMMNTAKMCLHLLIDLH